MPTSPLSSTHHRTTSCVACQHRLWAAHTVERRRAWHDITSFEQRIRSNNVERGMPSPPWDITHGQTTLGVACYHRLWAAQTVRRHRVWHSIMDLGQHTHGRTTSGVACYHSPWMAKRVERRWAWHAIIAFKQADTVGWRRAWYAIISLGRQTRSNDVGGGMPSPPWDSTHRRTTSGVACHHLLWATQTVGWLRAWHAIIALGQHTWSAMSGVALHHRPSTAHTVERRHAWHDITALGLHARSDDVERVMTSPPLDNKHGL